MQGFLVPQFIDVEDKIIGPITTRQFVLMLAGLLIAFIFYKLLSFWFFVGAAAITMGIIGTLAFLPVNGRPVHFFLLNFIQTFKRPMLRVWNKEAYINALKEVKSEIKETKKIVNKKEPVSGSRLRDLSIVVNTGGVYKGENDL